MLAGNTPVLVHNTNCGNLWGGKQDGWPHVLHEHYPGSPGVAQGNTVFDTRFMAGDGLDEIGELIEDAAQTRGAPNHGFNADGTARDGTIHRENAGYPIGTNGENSIEVILNPDGSLRTAYPVFGEDQIP